MEAGLKRLVDTIELTKTHRPRAVAFTDSLSLLMALSAGPVVVEDAILRRVCGIILRIVRHCLRASAGRRGAPIKDSRSGEGLCIGTGQES
ncbi:hypothetical protein ERJ75_000071200 [Trypanosoma vivax]|nr:hypothetical protein ERJ75_000626100 [Trypanosoma vivax]KAH8618894.1 hypothetical protein ERJ75_000229300 [Trypanosoma vivax]KAH8620319.1 hypothetical protein ERJ75_000071200 [Trypanosoma vivax]